MSGLEFKDEAKNIVNAALKANAKTNAIGLDLRALGHGYVPKAKAMAIKKLALTPRPGLTSLLTCKQRNTRNGKHK